MSWENFDNADVNLLKDLGLYYTRDIEAMQGMQAISNDGLFQQITAPDDMPALPNIAVRNGPTIIDGNECLVHVDNVKITGTVSLPDIFAFEMIFGKLNSVKLLNETLTESFDHYLKRVGVTKDGQLDRNFVQNAVLEKTPTLTELEQNCINPDYTYISKRNFRASYKRQQLLHNIIERRFPNALPSFDRITRADADMANSIAEPTDSAANQLADASSDLESDLIISFNEPHEIQASNDTDTTAQLVDPIFGGENGIDPDARTAGGHHVPLQRPRSRPLGSYTYQTLLEGEYSEGARTSSDGIDWRPVQSEASESLSPISDEFYDFMISVAQSALAAARINAASKTAAKNPKLAMMQFLVLGQNSHG